MNNSPSDPAELKLVARFDRNLIYTQGESVRFLVIDVQAPTIKTEARPKDPLNLALVIDASGSMSGVPIEAAKAAAVRVTEQLGESDLLSVVSFDTNVTVHMNAAPQGPGGRSTSAAAIGALQAGSSTDLSGGWLKGCECVAARMDSSHALRNRAVVFSDGHANSGILDPQALGAHAAELRVRGLLSSTVGIGDDYSDVQLEAIASHGGGRMHHAARPEEIAELVLAELEELRATVVDSVEVVVRVPPRVRLEVVGDYAARPEAGGNTVALGSLTSGSSRSVVFKVTCPPGTEGDTVAIQIGARWKPAGVDGSLDLSPQSCDLTFATVTECGTQHRDQELATRVARIWQLSVVRVATRLNQDGALERAKQYLEQELKHLSRYCKDLAGGTELLRSLVRMHESVGMMYGRGAAKEMLVASSKALRNDRDFRERPQSSWDSNLPS